MESRHGGSSRMVTSLLREHTHSHCQTTNCPGSKLWSLTTDRLHDLPLALTACCGHLFLLGRHPYFATRFLLVFLRLLRIHLRVSSLIVDRNFYYYYYCYYFFLLSFSLRHSLEAKIAITFECNSEHVRFASPGTHTSIPFYRFYRRPNISRISFVLLATWNIVLESDSMTKESANSVLKFILLRLWPIPGLFKSMENKRNQRFYPRNETTKRRKVMQKNEARETNQRRVKKKQSKRSE